MTNQTAPNELNESAAKYLLDSVENHLDDIASDLEQRARAIRHYAGLVRSQREQSGDMTFVGAPAFVANVAHEVEKARRQNMAHTAASLSEQVARIAYSVPALETARVQ